jgi:hypothetical protein
VSKLSTDGRVHLRSLLAGGALGDLLEDIEAEAQSILSQMLHKNLDNPDELAAAKSAQSTVRGYMMAVDRMRSILNDD